MGARAVAPALLLLLGLLAGACQKAPVAPQAEADLPALAARAMALGDYQQAAQLYRQALAREPESVPLRYGLGVAVSHLGRRDEAVRELSWVVDRGEPESSEVRAAEQWLKSVGALRRLAPPAGPRPPETVPVAGHGRLEGRALLASPDAPNDVQPQRRVKLSLIGQPNSPTKEARYTVRTDENGRYRFPDAIPGPYRLTDRIAGPPTWRLRVEIKSGETSSLDLTAANRVGVRDDFPE
jgi:tetratricopeptide (TPR) repeat protein